MVEKPDIDALAEQCRTGSPTAQIRAVRALEEADDRAAVPAILPLLQSDDALVRNAAAEVLGDLGEDDLEQVGPGLEALLTDSDALVRGTASEALGGLRYTPARPALERVLLDDEDATVRASAAEALGEMGEEDALRALEAALVDEDTAVRAYAAISIGLLGAEAQIPVLHSRIATEPDAGTRGELLAAALRLGDDSAFDEFLVLTTSIGQDRAYALLNAIEDLLSRRTPAVLLARATEFDQGLAKLGSLSDMVEASADRLRSRLAETVASATTGKE